MHISEGVLSGSVLVVGAAGALAGTGFGLKKIDHEQIVNVAILSSAFFVASLVHVNIGPVSAHLILNGVVGLLLGWAAFPAIFAALLLQALLFQYGGVTALGVNILIMALPAVLCFYIFKPFIGKSLKLTFAASFLTGALSVLFSAILLGAALWFTEENFFETIITVIVSHIPVMLIEGLITAFCVSFLLKVHPEIIYNRT